MHGQMSAETKRKERERKKQAGSKRKKTEGREWAGGTVEESGEEEESLDLILPSSLWNQQPSLLLGPAFPSNRRTLAEPCPSPRYSSYSLQPLEERPHPFLQNERVIWAKEKRRKFEVEKIWDLEIQLTALLWKKSSSSRWPHCRQAAEPTATLELEAGIWAGNLGTREGAARAAHTCSPGDGAGAHPWSCQSGTHLSPGDGAGAHPWSGTPAPPRLGGAAVSWPDGSGGAPSGEEEEDRRRQAVDSVCLLSAAPTSAPDTWEVPKARVLGRKRAKPCSEGLMQTQALPLPSGGSEPGGGERAALKKTGF